MALPQGVMEFLNANAQREGAGQLGTRDDLFRAGVLDSFSLVDLVSLLEDQCGVKIPDADVNPGNFQTIEKIEQYVESRKG
jgi:acyl carrier protein